MAYNEGLAERLREIIADRDNVIEKKMFGGLAFMADGNMRIGIEAEVPLLGFAPRNNTQASLTARMWRNSLALEAARLVRVGPEKYEVALKKDGAREMDFTGRALKGFVYVAPASYEDDTDLQFWVDLATSFVASLD